jgi:hypothetical protein
MLFHRAANDGDLRVRALSRADRRRTDEQLEEAAKEQTGREM